MRARSTHIIWHQAFHAAAMVTNVPVAGKDSVYFIVSPFHFDTRSKSQ